MSVYTAPKAAEVGKGKKVTTVSVREVKGQQKLTMITAYDFSGAVMGDEAGVDMLLVGDSLGMVMLGLSDTVGVTLDIMIHHACAVMRGAQRALVVADLPFMTYEAGVEQALMNATRFMQESGVRAFKLEGGREIQPQVAAMVRSGIPVMGHIGLTPQRAAVFGGFKVQGKTAAAAEALLDDARALQEAGAFSIVLEGIPSPVASMITKSIDIPTIGIGAGPDCDGQVLVFHDMLGLNTGHVPKFVKKFASLMEEGQKGVAAYVKEVREGTFPGPEHGYSMPEAELRALGKLK